MDLNLWTYLDKLPSPNGPFKSLLTATMIQKKIILNIIKDESLHMKNISNGIIMESVVEKKSWPRS